MSGEERRNKIIDLLSHSTTPVSGTVLAKELGVSRQVIVQDIALIRSSHYEILSTHRGYVIHSEDYPGDKDFQMPSLRRSGRGRIKLYRRPGWHCPECVCKP